MRTIDYKNPFKKRDPTEAFYLERKESRLGVRAELIREHLKRQRQIFLLERSERQGFLI